jgi:hypothetical protein
MERILDGEPLIAYLPAFQRTGFTELDFILNEDSDGWQMMLDMVADDLASQGVAMKPGHRLMILSRLRKAKVEMERDPEESRQRHPSPSPPGLVKAASHEDDRDQQQMSAFATCLDGFKPLWNVPIGWRMAMTVALLSLSLSLWGLYQACANQVYNAAFIQLIAIMTDHQGRRRCGRRMAVCQSPLHQRVRCQRHRCDSRRLRCRSSTASNDNCQRPCPIHPA